MRPSRLSGARSSRNRAWAREPETVKAALTARRVKSLLSPVVSVVVALCTAFVLWRGAGLIVHVPH